MMLKFRCLPFLFIVFKLFLREGPLFIVPGAFAQTEDEEIRNLFKGDSDYDMGEYEEEESNGNRVINLMEATDRPICTLGLAEMYTCIFCNPENKIRHTQLLCNELLPDRVKSAQMRCIGHVLGFDMSLGYLDKDTFSMGCQLNLNLREVFKCVHGSLEDLPIELFLEEEAKMADYSHCIHTLASSACCAHENKTETAHKDQPNYIPNF